MTKALKIIMIDNYDSFTYNLVNQFRLLGAEVIIYRNDTPIENIFDHQSLKLDSTIIVISPGPGNPNTAGNSLSIINQYAGHLPILGICLGHQAIVQHFGGTIGQAKKIIHGKADQIYFHDNTIFSQLTSPFRAARYHSLVGTKIPTTLKVIASTEDEVMAVMHEKNKILGFQFHPESILTTYGNQLLTTSLNWLTDTATRVE